MENKEYEGTTYAEDYVGIMNLKLRDYKKKLIELQKLSKTKKLELQSVRDFYDPKIEEANHKINELQEELMGVVESSGNKSLTSSLGRVTVSTSRNPKFKFPSDQDFMKSLPVEYTHLAEPELELEKQKLERDVTITDDGRVVFKDTGEIVKGASATPAGQKSFRFYPDGIFKNGVDKWEKKKWDL